MASSRDDPTRGGGGGLHGLKSSSWLVLLAAILVIMQVGVYVSGPAPQQPRLISNSQVIRAFNFSLEDHHLEISSSTASSDEKNGGPHSSLSPSSSIVSKQQVEPWSVEDLQARNITSMFELAPEAWPLSSQPQQQRQCPYPGYSFYVYDNLPDTFTVKLEDLIRVQAHKRQRVHENPATEWALVQLFRTSPCRTLNASMASLFIVPYMHAAHCRFHEGYAFACGHIPKHEFQPLFDALEYYQQYASRHVFLGAHANPMMNGKITTGSHLKLTADKMMMPDHVKPTALVIPIIHDDPQFQPSRYYRDDPNYWTRPRKYAFASFYGGTNTRMKKNNHRRFRQFFLNAISQFTSNNTFAGMPYVAVQTQDFGTHHFNPMDVYRDSVLCPVLPGDCCWARRFFDVIRSGCLPVVLEWHLANHQGRSWHTPKWCSLQESYPFFPKNVSEDGSVLSVDPQLEIDYDAFVVRAPGNPQKEDDMTSLFQAMKDILDKPEELKRRQTIMMQYAPLFTAGLGREAHVYPDMFDKILQRLQKEMQVQAQQQ